MLLLQCGGKTSEIRDFYEQAVHETVEQAGPVHY
jgi:hypothetical protein